MQYNRAFEEMMRPAREWLAGKDPQEIAERSGVQYDADAQAFRMRVLGSEYVVRWPEWTVEDVQAGWMALVLLHYLNRADGMPLSGEWISFSMLKEGMVRGGGFDRSSERALEQMLKERSEEQIRKAFERLDGRTMETNADLSAMFEFMPRYPLMLKIWLADDEWGASGKLLLDRSADHYLPVEDAVTVGEIFLEELKRALNS